MEIEEGGDLDEVILIQLVRDRKSWSMGGNCILALCSLVEVCDIPAMALKDMYAESSKLDLAGKLIDWA